MLGVFVSPEDVAKAVIYLASSAYASGSTVLVGRWRHNRLRLRTFLQSPHDESPMLTAFQVAPIQNVTKAILRMKTLKIAMPLLLAVTAVCTVFCQQANAAEISSGNSDKQVYAVIHVDVAPSQVAAALPVLQSFAQQAKRDPAVSHIDVLQQLGAPNHFTVIEVIHSRQMYDRFVEEDYVKTMRDKLQPMLGSPFDERLHGIVQEASK